MAQGEDCQYYVVLEHKNCQGCSVPIMDDSQASAPIMKGSRTNAQCRIIRVDGPPAHPTSLGDVWIGHTKPRFVETEQESFMRNLDELEQLRAMKQRLLVWAGQLEENRDKPGDVGHFIAAELRNRMDQRESGDAAGTPVDKPSIAELQNIHSAMPKGQWPLASDEGARAAVRLLNAVPMLLEVVASVLAYQDAECTSPRCTSPAHRVPCAILATQSALERSLTKVRP